GTKTMARIDKDQSCGTPAPARLDGRHHRRHSSAVSRIALLGAMTAALLGSGCGLQQWVDNGFKVGPNYCRPAAPVASEWIDDRDPRVKSEEADLSEWWRVFNDPVLNNLEETAYRQNLTLRAAGSRILAARAREGIAVGNLFPQLQDATGSYTRNKI